MASVGISGGGIHNNVMTSVGISGGGIHNNPKGSIIVPDFTISVYSSSCMSLCYATILLIFRFFCLIVLLYSVTKGVKQRYLLCISV